MGRLDTDNPLGLSAAALSEVDQVCERFECAWRKALTGETQPDSIQARPQPNSYLAQADPLVKPALLVELVMLDIDYRLRLGERPSQADYADLFGVDHAALETVFGDATAETHSNSGQPTSPSPVGANEAGRQDPTALGRYRVIERVGSGSFGTVYRAHDDELDRDVAIKVPHAHLFDKAPIVELFRREARALATLRHPAIVPVYDVHFDDSDPTACFVVSQFMEGGDLAAAWQEHRFDAISVANIVQRIAEALHYAHTHGLVHRDVKLSNILRDADGNVQIADFGLALRDEDFARDDVATGEIDGGQTPTSGLVGTPSNMSPEQARGEGGLVDGRTDVYGLGVVLYQLLTHKRPFAEKEVTALLSSIQSRDPKPPRQYDDNIPKELERICLKALSKEPAQRYPTACDLASDLRRYLRSLQPRGWSARGALATAALAVAGIAGWWTLVGSRSDFVPSAPSAHSRIKTLAILPFRPLGVEGASAELDLLGEGMADTLATKLGNARQLVVRSSESVQGNTNADDDPLAAGRALQVDAIVTGSLQQIGDRTRASVRLLRVDNGHSVWAETFDEAAADLFAVQDAISTQVVQSLALQLTPNEERRIKLRYTDSREAYEEYVKGRHAWQQRARVPSRDLERAIKHFRAAIDADPLFALAYVGLAESYAMTNLYQGYDQQAYPRARAAAKKALELDPELTDAHAVLALVTHYCDWDFSAAEDGFKRAIELNPNNASARQWYAELLYFSQRFDEALDQLKKAAELDPLSPVIADLQGVPYMWRRDYERARVELEKALRANPTSGNVLYGLGTIAMQQGRLEDAIEYHRQHGSEYQEAYVLTKMGQMSDARAILERRADSFTPFQEAVVHIGLGEFDNAFARFDAAIEQRDERLVWILVDPKLDPIRDDPRFLKLLKAVGR